MEGAPARGRTAREALVRFAATEIDRQGFSGASLTDLLAGSGTSKGAFYFHFTSKDHLAAVLVERMAAALSPVLAQWARRDVDALRRLVGIGSDVAHLMASDPVVRAGVRIVAEGARVGVDATRPLHDWVRIVTTLLRRAEHEGLLRAGVDPVDAAQVVLAAVLGQRYLSEQLGGAGLVDRVRSTCALLLPALARDEWLSGWDPVGWPG